MMDFFTSWESQSNKLSLTSVSMNRDGTMLMNSEELMEFKITEEEAREMARFEEQVGGDISAGSDWGVHLGSVMALALASGGLGKESRNRNMSSWEM